MNAETNAGKGAGGSRKSLLELVDKTVTRLQASIKTSFTGQPIDPLSGDNRGQALTYLQQMSIDLANGQELKPEQQSFLTQVLDLEKLEKKGTKNVMFPRPPIEDIGGTAGQVIGSSTPAAKPPVSEILRQPAAAPAASSTEPDQYGFTVGSEITIPAGDHAGRWQYVGGNSWKKIG
jgi:hypothetical protein